MVATVGVTLFGMPRGRPPLFVYFRQACMNRFEACAIVVGGGKGVRNQ